MATDIPAALAAALDGGPLMGALDLSPRHVAAVRRQAEALYEAGKWTDCVTALEVLVHLGDVGPFDALMRARCHARLGQADLARRWGDVAKKTLGELDLALAPDRSTS